MRLPGECVEPRIFSDRRADRTAASATTAAPAANTFLNARRIQVVQLAAFHRLPAVYPARDFVEVGELMSYGTNIMGVFRELGIYAGRILKGEKPADLPVPAPVKFELVVNLRAARVMGLAVPAAVIARADEVIE
jgi:putative ABC transport system substrate-binding protein